MDKLPHEIVEKICTFTVSIPYYKVGFSPRDTTFDKLQTCLFMTNASALENVIHQLKCLIQYRALFCYLKVDTFRSFMTSLSHPIRSIHTNKWQKRLPVRLGDPKRDWDIVDLQFDQ